jgi:hypothetical protein
MTLFFRTNCLFLLILVLLASCNNSHKTELLTGQWKYDRVFKKNKPFLEVTQNDVLALNQSGEFSYNLLKAGISGEGRWEFIYPNTLVLHYNDPDTIRYFKISVLTENRLEFSENELLFTYNRSNLLNE